MAINLHRAERKTDDYLLLRNATSDSVAPGTYVNTHNTPAEPKGESAIPFMSSEKERTLNQNKSTSNITPGPGAYARQETDVDGFSGVGATALKSAVARFGPTAPGSSVYRPSTNEANPGPGTYQEKTLWSPRLRKATRPKKESVLGEREKTVPSIPLSRLLPGMESDRDAEVSSLRVRHTGDRNDKVGPGEYDPRGEECVHKTAPQTNFYGSKQTRALWEPTCARDNKLPPRENPGPGSYEPLPGVGEIPKEGYDLDVSKTCQFSSTSILPYQVEMSEDKVKPGPGHYTIEGHLQVSAKRALDKGSFQGERSQFGSLTARVGWNRPVGQPFKDPYHVHNVPGPGHYKASSSIWPDDPKKVEAEKILPSSQRKKLHGVHHPAIVMALQEMQGPLQAFNTTDDRPCNRTGEQQTPAPGQYNKEEARGHSITSTLRERAKVGKRGVFGTCADRFYGSPLEGRAGLPEPGTDFGDAGGAGANTEPRAMFQSTSPRFHHTAGPRETSVTKIGHKDTPAPGDYEVSEPTYRSPFRHPRADHLSFGSGQRRFEEMPAADLFFQHRPPTLNPGPGSYDYKETSRATGAAKLEAARKPLHVGCTTEVVGPGSYGTMAGSLMLKKTFNVTTKMPYSARLPLSRDK